LIAATLPASASPASSTYASTPADQARVVEAMRTMYAAAAADDVDKFHTIAARTSVPSTAASAMTATLMKIAKSFHDSGKVFVSTVTDPHVEANCDLAWLTYTSRGSMRDASGTTQLTWLESAVLEKQAGTRRIRFFHSTRIP
jgi:hypothetical protein